MHNYMYIYICTEVCERILHPPRILTGNSKIHWQFTIGIPRGLSAPCVPQFKEPPPTWTPKVMQNNGLSGCHFGFRAIILHTFGGLSITLNPETNAPEVWSTNVTYAEPEGV